MGVEKVVEKFLIGMGGGVFSFPKHLKLAHVCSKGINLSFRVLKELPLPLMTSTTTSKKGIRHKMGFSEFFVNLSVCTEDPSFPCKFKGREGTLLCKIGQGHHQLIGLLK